MPHRSSSGLPLFRVLRLIRALLALALAASPAVAQIPPGYYDSVDTSNPTALRTTLHEVIDDHQRFPYSSGATDTWDILEAASEDPSNTNNILDVYQNDSHPKQGAGNSLYNREHTWPNSYGFPDDGATNYPFTDCHLLFLCDGSYNSSRGNKPFRYCTASCPERTTVANDGQGGGSGTYPGNSNWTTGSNTSGTWEVWIGRRGDVARAQLYADVRYAGGLHNGTGISEPNLLLTDNQTLIANSNTGNNESVAYMGMLSVLLQWHLEDPVDDWERNRNDVIYTFQGNRNPFVDHPEWVHCIFESTCAGGGAGTPSCFGVGCPCGNDDPLAGCENSSGNGGLLGSSGTNDISNDDLVLEGSQLPPNNQGLFYMGNANVQFPFFDGFQCALGTTYRFSDDIQSSGPTGTMTLGPGIVATTGGLITAGSTWHFHAWHRDVAVPSPCGTGANLTNLYSVTFVP